MAFCVRSPLSFSLLLAARATTRLPLQSACPCIYKRCFSATSPDDGKSNPNINEHADANENADTLPAMDFEVEAKRLRLQTDAALEASKYTKAREQLSQAEMELGGMEKALAASLEEGNDYSGRKVSPRDVDEKKLEVLQRQNEVMAAKSFKQKAQQAAWKFNLDNKEHFELKKRTHPASEEPKDHGGMYLQHYAMGLIVSHFSISLLSMGILSGLQITGFDTVGVLSSVPPDFSSIVSLPTYIDTNSDWGAVRAAYHGIAPVRYASALALMVPIVNVGRRKALAHVAARKRAGFDG